MSAKHSSSIENIERRLRYFTRVRDYAQSLVDNMERNLQSIEAHTGDFKREFASIRKKNESLLDKANRRVAREYKRLMDAQGT
jgi:predicted  nucleic acid-binding Zn-ribbon protein